MKSKTEIIKELQLQFNDTNTGWNRMSAIEHAIHYLSNEETKEDVIRKAYLAGVHDCVNGDIDSEDYVKKFLSSVPLTDEQPSVGRGSEDMTAREFFDAPESPITLDKICNQTEKEFLLDMIELYAKGKVNQASPQPPAEVDKIAEEFWDKHRKWFSPYNVGYGIDKESFLEFIKLTSLPSARVVEALKAKDIVRIMLDSERSSIEDDGTMSKSGMLFRNQYHDIADKIKALSTVSDE